MITLETKVEAKGFAPLGQLPSNEAPTLSFSQLLKGIGVESQEEDAVLKEGALLLSLSKEEEGETVSPQENLLSLLKNDTKSLKTSSLKTLEAPVELNPQLFSQTSTKELKVLVQDAKNYLRDKITASEGFKKSEIDALPKTLKGLVQVAEKFSIDVSKITIEDVQVNNKLSINSETTDIDAKLINQMSAEERVKELPKESKNTPLFKAQVTKEITTEQLVQTRMSIVEAKDVKPAKVKADETLKILLCGEKVSKQESGFTADFSVATAKVIAPQATTDVSKNLESLLRGEQGESNSVSKLDGLSVNKSDSFEVKLNEAKQMTKYLSQDIKSAIEDYKSPFTRVKVQLNPQRLGEIDLTIVQRGKNLHIDLSSNNTAINTLALNANDLKVQLVNNGINNATLNFNNNPQSSEQGSFGQQQQNQGQRQEAKEEYNYFKNEEKNEEILNSLEIVVPHYA